MKHTLSWQKGKEVKINYRPVNLSTLTNDVQTKYYKKNNF